VGSVMVECTKPYENNVLYQPKVPTVITLALGSQPRQGLAKLQAKSELKSHISYS
jgi:hypothetical protein